MHLRIRAPGTCLPPKTASVALSIQVQTSAPGKSVAIYEDRRKAFSRRLEHAVLKYQGPYFPDEERQLKGVQWDSNRQAVNLDLRATEARH